MSEKLDKEEVREMIEQAIHNKLPEAFNDSLEKFMQAYGLKPQHWVFLEAEYNKAMSRQSLIRKIILTSIVTAISMATLWGAEDWIKRIVVDSMRTKTEQHTPTANRSNK